MKKCYCILLVLGAFVYAKGEVFEHTYNHAPLYEVLQDIEHTFGVSFMYRPSDIANAPEISGVFRGNCYTQILYKILPPTLQCVQKKSILVLVQKPKQKLTNTHSLVEIPNAAVPLVSAETLPEPSAVPLIPIDYLRPSSPVYVHIDLRRIEPNVLVVISPTISVDKPLAHAFAPSVSIGYGSQLQTRIDLLYRLRFKQYWAFSAGLCAGYMMSPQNNYAAHEIGLGLPLNFHYIRPFHSTIPHLTGWQTTIGFMPYFPVAHWGGTITIIGVDLVPSAGWDLIFENTKVLGLYGQCSALNGVPWSIGVRFAYIIGEK